MVVSANKNGSQIEKWQEKRVSALLFQPTYIKECEHTKSVKDNRKRSKKMKPMDEF